MNPMAMLAEQLMAARRGGNKPFQMGGYGGRAIQRRRPTADRMALPGLTPHDGADHGPLPDVFERATAQGPAPLGPAPVGAQAGDSLAGISPDMHDQILRTAMESSQQPQAPFQMMGGLAGQMQQKKPNDPRAILQRLLMARSMGSSGRNYQAQ